MLRLTLLSGLSLLLSLCGCGTSRPARSTASPASAPTAQGVLVNRDHRGVALSGFDPVAYFTDGSPIQGDPNMSAVHRGATYYFASDAHRWQFLREPDRFAPAFGGYCGYAASIGRLSPVSPQFWQILDGRLVLQHNQHAFELFNQDARGSLARADANWPRLSQHNALPAHYVVNADAQGVAIGGYDPISYLENRPQRGVPEHAARYGGATYWFVSEAQRAKFESDPARHAPAFGGFCGYAASIGTFAPVDPTLFVLVDGRLVLQHTPEALRLFARDTKQNLARADAHWPALVARAGL
jgi:YHS domain-containing protein